MGEAAALRLRGDLPSAIPTLHYMVRLKANMQKSTKARKRR